MQQRRSGVFSIHLLFIEYTALIGLLAIKKKNVNMLKYNLLVLFLMQLLIAKYISAQDGKNLFNDTILHKIEFFEVDTSQIADPEFKGIYQSVQIKIDGVEFEQVGLSTKGEKSYAAAPNNKKPFKIKMNKYVTGQKCDGIKRFNLHNNLYDNSIMREKFTCDGSLMLGIPAPRIAFTEVYINGDYWGVYTLVEAQDEIYKRTFGDDDGVTMESFGSEANLLNLVYYGDVPDNYAGQYVVDKGDEETTWGLWIKLLYKINTLPAREAYVDSVSKYIDYPSYFRFNAVLDYNLNAEPKNRNGIYYFDIETKKWYTICWDQNVSFSDFGDPNLAVFPNTAMTGFLDKYATYFEFSDAYNKTLCRLANEIFTDEAVNSKVMTFRKVIDEAVRRDTRKGFTFKQYEQSLLDLRNFIFTRNIVASKFLETQNYSCSATGISVIKNESEIRVFPVPATNYVNVIAPEFDELDYEIYSVQGTPVLKGSLVDSTIVISSLSTGVYFLKIRQKDGWLTEMKLIKM